MDPSECPVNGFCRLTAELFGDLRCKRMAWHEVELWPPQLHLGAPSADASKGVPPLKMVTPARRGLLRLRLGHREIS